MSEKEEYYYKVACLNLDTDEELYALVEARNEREAFGKVENDSKMPKGFELYSVGRIMLSRINRGKVVWVTIKDILMLRKGQVLSYEGMVQWAETHGAEVEELFDNGVVGVTTESVYQPKADLLATFLLISVGKHSSLWECVWIEDGVT
jgi:hypothetical protein